MDSTTQETTTERSRPAASGRIRSVRRTLYRKNIRQWEQWSRVVAGVAMIAAAVAVAAVAGKVLLVTGGAAMIVTGIVGWCPACAAIGRRLEQDASRAAS